MYAFDVVFLITASVSTLVAALRVHAVSGRNWRWVLPVWLLGMVPVGINIWLMTEQTWVIIPQLGCISIVTISQAIYNAIVIVPRASVVASDILVISATWYYIGRTSSVRSQLVGEIWDVRPNLTTVMFRDGTLYFLIISLLNTVDLTMNAINNTRFHSSTIDITILITAMSSILISRFLICIREAAERTTQEFSSPSFVDSQGKSSPQAWLSSAEFAADIDNPSAGDSNADAFSDLDDDLNSRGEDDAGEVESNEIEFEEYAASASSIDARSS